MSERSDRYRGFHFPVEIISHAVWLYARFALSYRDVDELLAERGIQLSYESVRRCVGRFGEPFTAEMLRRERRVGRTWHLDEVFVRIGGEHRRVRSAARLNNRVEQSHLPTRLRERRMQGFRSMHSAQHFLCRFSRGCNLFRPRRHLLAAAQYRSTLQVRFLTWSEITGVVCA